MNLKSTLWTLAFAVAAVSCSDELEEGGGTGTGNEENGEGVYVTVNVGMASGPTTKAGELGDDDLEDSDVESAVHDVNIFLVQVTPILGQDYTGMTGNDISYVNADGNTTISSGYSTDIQSATGSIPNHDLEATVRVSVPDLDQWYHVITVVNAGKDLGFTKLEQLRDYLQKNAWSGDNKYDEYGKGAHNFVMSTHQMYQNNVGGSELHVTAANTDPSNPAETTVYVERLAARIDMNLASDLVSVEGASLESDDNSYDNNDKVWITGYQVVNQMMGGTYMLKRVTDYTKTTSVTASIPTSPILTYLGDEIWQDGAYNYVIDPWTLNKKETTTGGETSFPEEIKNSGAYYSGSAGNYTKTEANASTPPYNLAKNLYINHFREGLNTPDFLKFNPVKGIQITNGSFTPLLYVQENTADVAQQKKGFTTGVIFEAEYKPEHVSQYVEDGEGAPKVNNEVDYTAGNAFLVADYEHNNWANRKLASDMRTIAALGLKDGSDPTIVKAMFTDGAPNWDSKTKENVQQVVSDMRGGELVKAFHDYLQGVLDASESLDDNAKAALTWKAFVEASHRTDEDNKIDYVPTADDLKNGISGKKSAAEVRAELLEHYNIAYYAEGENGAKNYLKYWIKHDPNGTDDDPMGVMEFAIVRNNVYQLAVTGVSGLGDPLPFTPGTDDPDDPVKEEEEVQILVRLYVRNWVKRYNSDIIL